MCWKLLNQREWYGFAKWYATIDAMSFGNDIWYKFLRYVPLVDFIQNEDENVIVKAKQVCANCHRGFNKLNLR